MRSLVLSAFLLLPIPSLAGVFVGYSDRTITPTPEEAAESCLGGYVPFTRCGVTEIHSDISVRSLSISSPDQNMIISVIDTIGVGDSIIAEITNEVHLRSFGLIKRNEVFLTATHTHHGPDLQGLWGGVSILYRDRIVEDTVRSILAAYVKKAPATISVGEADASVENRRGWPEADTSMKIVTFKNKWTSARIASLVNMSAHPTLVPREAAVYSADYIGAMRDTIEHALGSDVIFINGIIGDVQPMVDAPLSLETAEQFGTNMGLRVVDAESTAVRVVGKLKVKTSEFTHPVQNEALLGAALAGFLDLELNSDYSVTTQLAVFQIGDELSGILFPGEALTRLGLPLRDQLPGEHKLFFGLSGDSLGYFLPSDEFMIFPERMTEEQVSLHPFIGDNSIVAFEDLIAAPYVGRDPHWPWNRFLDWLLVQQLVKR